jgi:hypothetical protein
LPPTAADGQPLAARGQIRLAAASRVTVAGDSTAWTPVDVPSDGHGTFRVDVTVPRDRRWRYRFCLDDTRWINDPLADDFEFDADASGISVRRS